MLLCVGSNKFLKLSHILYVVDDPGAGATKIVTDQISRGRIKTLRATGRIRREFLKSWTGLMKEGLCSFSDNVGISYDSVLEVQPHVKEIGGRRVVRVRVIFDCETNGKYKDLLLLGKAADQALEFFSPRQK